MMQIIHFHFCHDGRHRLFQAARLLSSMVVVLFACAVCSSAQAQKAHAARKPAPLLRRVVIVSYPSRQLNIGTVDKAGNLAFEKYGGLTTQHPFIADAIDVRGRYLFLLAKNKDEIDVYRVTGKPGVRRANTVKIAKAMGIFQLACHPTKDILYACSDKSISQYTILADGGLEKLDVAPVPAANCRYLQFDLPHNRLYAVSARTGYPSSFYTFNISRDGTLSLAAQTPLGPEVSDCNPGAFVVDSAKETLYVDTEFGRLYQYSIDAAGHAIALAEPFLEAPGAGVGVLLDSDGKVVRVCGMTEMAVWAYRVTPSGALTRWIEGDIPVNLSIGQASFDPVSRCYFFPFQGDTEVWATHERRDGLLDPVRWTNTVAAPTVLLIVDPPK